MAVRPIKIPITAIDKTKSGVNAATGNLRRLRGSLDGIKSAIAAIGIGYLAKGIISTRVEFENLRASLTTVTGSLENAEAAFARIKQFAATTPFSVQQATEAFVKLKALGLDPSEEALRSYGNTASAMGKSLSQMIEAVADATTGEFERLKEFGIKAKSEGDKVSFTFQGVTTTIGKNAAEIEEYLRRVGDVQFAGAMERQAKTIGGALSNMQDGFSQFADALGQAVEPAIIAVAQWLGEGLPKAARNFLRGFYYTRDKIVEIAAIITYEISKMFDTLAKLPDFLGGDKFAKAAEGYKGLTREIIEFRNSLDDINEKIPVATQNVGNHAAAVRGLTADQNGLTAATNKSTKELQRSAQRVKTSVKTPMETLNDELAELDMLLDKGLITWEDYGRAVENAQEKASRQIQKANKDIIDSSDFAWKRVGDSIEDFVRRGEFNLNSLKDFALQVLGQIAGQMLGGGSGGFSFGNIFSGGGQVDLGIGSAIGSAISGLFGFAKGGSFTVGGRGGTDQNLVAFRATKGERVEVTTPAQQQNGNGVTVVYNIDASNSESGVEEKIRNVLNEETPRIIMTAINGSVDRVQSLANRGGSFAKSMGRI